MIEILISIFGALALWTWMSLLGLQKQIRRLEKEIKVEGGPFISANIKYPKRLKRFSFTADILDKWHVHKLTPRKIAHLLHLVKQMAPGFPETAILRGADIDISRNVWTLLLEDESFPEHEPGMTIPEGSIAMVSNEVTMRLGFEDCPECNLEAMGAQK